jgi:hypothetical protein
MIFTALLFVACGPKKSQEPEAPKVGWIQEGEGSMACYYPPAFQNLEPLARKEAQSTSFDALIAQWSGDRGDGVSMSADLVETVETIMLGDMSKVESVVRDNLSYCKQYASSPSASASWETWLSSLPAKLTEGECNHHYSVILAHYVEVDVDWEPAEPLRICGGDKIRVRAAPHDRYQLEPGGPWITVDGNSEVSTAGSDRHPCNTDGCLEGQLVIRFQSTSGLTEVVPVGSDGTYTAPEEGVFTYGINDDSPENNKWYNANGLIEHADIRIEPVQ